MSEIYIYSVIRLLSVNGVVTVDNDELNEVTYILNGLNVKYSIIKFETNVTNIILAK